MARKVFWFWKLASLGLAAFFFFSGELDELAVRSTVLDRFGASAIIFIVFWTIAGGALFAAAEAKR